MILVGTDLSIALAMLSVVAGMIGVYYLGLTGVLVAVVFLAAAIISVAVDLADTQRAEPPTGR